MKTKPVSTPDRKNKPKLRLEKPTKAYPLNQCALYGIRGIGQLISVLRWKRGIQELEGLISREDNYLVYKEKGTGRWIQEPKTQIDLLQARIATLLRRVAPPDFRHSGVRGRSFLTNAKAHIGRMPALKIDIRKFYPSTNYYHVRDFFI